MQDIISRQTAIERMTEAIWHYPNEFYQRLNDYEIARELAEFGLLSVPSAHQTLYGYDIEHLKLIADVLQKENLPPDRVADALMDIGRIVAIVTDEFEETLRKAAEQCRI